MQILKKVITAVLAIAVFGGTMFLELQAAQLNPALNEQKLFVEVPAAQSIQLTHAGSQQKVEGKMEHDLNEGDSITTGEARGVVVHLGDHAFGRLEQHTTLVITKIDPEKPGFILQLTQGRAWFNTTFAATPINLMAGGAYIIPHQTAFDVSFDGQKTLVYAQQHHLNVGLITADYQSKMVMASPASDFINSYLLPEGNQTTIYAEKIKNNQQTLQKLFYSKLIKEFPSGLIDPQTLKKDPWISQNIEADKVDLATLSAAIVEHIRGQGLRVASLNSLNFQLSQAGSQFAKTFTFFDDKSIARSLDDLFVPLYDAQYLALFGRATESKERLDYFKNKINETLNGDANQSLKAALLNRLLHEYQNLEFTHGDDQLYSTKTALANLLLAHGGHSDQDVRDKLLVVRDTMNQVYDLAEKNTQTARQLLEDYYKQLTDLVAKEKTDIIKVKSLLAEENQIMDNLLLQYPQFYRDRFFFMKNTMEQQWLGFLPEGEDKNEEKQHIISTKIDFLRQLKKFFLMDKVLVDDAKQIVFRLFREAEDLQLPPQQQSAVGELFAKRLDDFGNFYRFLSTPEYVSTTIHGNTNQERFNQFMAAQQQQVSIEEVRKEIVGGETQTAPATTNVTPESTTTTVEPAPAEPTTPPKKVCRVCTK